MKLLGKLTLLSCAVLTSLFLVVWAQEGAGADNAVDPERNPIIVEVQDEGFERRAMLENIAMNVVLPLQQTFVQETQALEGVVQALSQNPSPETLQATQEAWLAASTAWQRVNLFEVGGLEMTVLFNQINKAPTDPALIDKAIAEGASADKVGSTSKGLPALEYLLFNPDGDEAVLTSLQDSQRMGYLVDLSQNLSQKASELHTLWSPDGENYAATFAAADEQGGKTQGSINMLVNEMINQSEMIVRDKLGGPLGKMNGGEPAPELAEAERSEGSTANLISNVEALKMTFNGAEGLGFDDYLDYINAFYAYGPLSETINRQLDETLTALHAIDLPLSQAVTETPDAVQAAYDKARLLVILLKSDMGNQMGVTVTFNDTDGD